MKTKTFWSILSVLFMTASIYWGCTATQGTDGTLGLLSGGAPCTSDSECINGLCFGTGNCAEPGCVTQEGVHYCDTSSCKSSLDSCSEGASCVLTSGTCTTCYVSGAQNDQTTANARCAAGVCDLDQDSSHFGACVDCSADTDCPTGSDGSPDGCVSNTCVECNHLSETKDTQCNTGSVCSNSDTCITQETCDDELSDFCSNGLTCVSHVCR